MNATINSATGVSPHYVITGRQPNIGLPNLPHNEPTNQSPTAYGMQINALLRHVHRRIALANNEADHKLNTILNQLVYKYPIQVGDKVLLHCPQSTTAHLSQLDWIGHFKIVETNDIVIKVRNEKSETDRIYRTHIRHLAPRTVLFQTIQFSMSTQFNCQKLSISSYSV